MILFAPNPNQVSVTTGEAITVPANSAIPIYLKDDKGGVPEGSWSATGDEPSGGYQYSGANIYGGKIFIGSNNSSVGLRSKSLDTNGVPTGNWSSKLSSAACRDFTIYDGYLYYIAHSSTRYINYATIDSSGNLGTFSSVLITTTGGNFYNITSGHGKLFLTHGSRDVSVVDLDSGVPQSPAVVYTFNTNDVGSIYDCYYSEKYRKLYLSVGTNNTPTVYYAPYFGGIQVQDIKSFPRIEDGSVVMRTANDKMYTAARNGNLRYMELTREGDPFGDWSDADQEGSSGMNGLVLGEEKVYILQQTDGIYYKSISAAASDNGKALKLTNDRREDLFGIIGNATATDVSIATDTSTKVRVGGIQSGLSSLTGLAAGDELDFFGKRAGVGLGSNMLFVDPDIS